ncbi:hypothetical protein [Rosistilla oblonga]|uniref:Uncharacterized protein n=1 Tax=Rosistilla oblonga TaxID=2527990 RepID=A0A518IS61_9BACT|nr:hypothetical protein [Rosistilla oblonga]QDV55920.1 hypothetical protein Mal33_18990 [Rosistilla oblonga]
MSLHVVEHWVLLIGLLVGMFSIPQRTARATEIGSIERYALAVDRQQFLQDLIPGSADYYYFHALHHQTMGQPELAAAYLADWSANKAFDQDPRLLGMQHRQHLLQFEATPDRTLEYLRRHLNVNLDHQPPRVRGQRQLPASLDAALIDGDEQLLAAAERRETLTSAGQRRLVQIWTAADQPDDIVSPQTLRWLLERLDQPALPKIVDLVITELQQRRPQHQQFGDLPIHDVLTLDELQQVRRQVKEVASDDGLVSAILLRLRPSADSDPSQQPQVYHDYLQRAEEFVRTLPDAYNGLKASVLYHRLAADLKNEQFEKQRFIDYLALPRQSPIVLPKLIERSLDGTIAELNHDYRQQAMLPPIGDDQPLVRAYLEHFLRDAASPEAFAQYLRPEYLRDLFAETKLLAGIEPRDQWFAQLSPEDQKALQERVEVTLAATNSEYQSIDEPAALHVDIKNVDELMIRTYRINTEAYCRAGRKPLSTAIDLDGLVANHSRSLKYDLPALRRHRQRIELPEIQGRGVWVVDLLGGGRRSRALIRRGDLRFAETIGAAGHRFQVLREDGTPAAQARLQIGTQEFTADESGTIIVPFAAKTTTRDAILIDDAIAMPIKFRHRAESYKLEAGFHTHRQQLQPGKLAEILIRPRLWVADRPIDPKIVEEVEVQVTATDLDGVATSKRYRDLEFTLDRELEVQFRVPRRTVQITASVSGRVASRSGGERVEVDAIKVWKINETEKTDAIADLFLARHDGGWSVEARGRSGEPLVGQAIQLSLRHRYRSNSVDVTLQTDETGTLHLGPLTDINTLAAVSSGLPSRTWPLRESGSHWPAEIHALAETEIAIPTSDLDDDADRFRIWEERAGQPYASVDQALSVRDGAVRLKALAAGDYRLVDNDHNRSLVIRVTAGIAAGDYLMGEMRELERRPPLSTSIAKAAVEGDAFVVQLSGANPLSRVHLFGGRYLPGESPAAALGLDDYSPRIKPRSIAASGFVSDRRLDEEYQYVLRRRNATKYPGNLLPQPSLILNPWETDTTENARQDAMAGDVMESRAAAAPPMPADSMHRNEPFGHPLSLSASWDFLPTQGSVLTNLEVDANGRLSIPLNALGDASLIRVVVSDPISIVQQTVTRDLPQLQPNDLRLRTILDPAKRLSQTRAVLIASQAKPLDLSELGAARMQIYSTVGDLYRLYSSVVEDERWPEFEPLSRWHELNNEQRLDLYGRLACHELHLFLYHKDRPFFDAVVLPYLKNKLEKTFVDRWLLEEDLSTYTQLWKYEQLNAAEKALLAMRLDSSRAAVVREFDNRIALQDEDLDAVRSRIDAALLGLELDDQGGAVMFGFGGGMGGMGDAFADGVVSESLSAMPELKADEKAGSAVRQLMRRKKRSVEAQLSEDEAANMSLFYRESDLQRVAGRGFFRPLPATRQWAESQYDRIRRIEQTPDLVPVGRYWQHLAEHDGTQPFVSSELLVPTETRTAALIALATTGLPFASDADLPAGEDQPQFAPPHPVAVVTEQLREVRPLEGDSPVLVGQRFEADGERDDEKPTAFAPAEFLVGQPYLGQIVLTNPTPTIQQIDVLWQIPAGAMPLSGGRETDSRQLELEPFATQTLEYQFYFPSAGQFKHYPASVSADGMALASGEPRTFGVVDNPTQIDEETWEYIALRGDAAKIADFLKTANLRKLDWTQVAPRLRDRAIYDVVLRAMTEFQVWDETVWGYAVYHKDAPRITELISNDTEFVAACGPVLRSSLLTIDPVDRDLYEHLEYAPLVRSRIHPLRDQPEIMNDRLLQQYRHLMNVLSYQRKPSTEQQLALCYYLLLQNRIEEAIRRFETVARDEATPQLQYDYLDAYLALFAQDYRRAAAIADNYQSFPIPRWRQRFTELSNQLEQRRVLMSGAEIAGAERPADALPTADAADLSVWGRDSAQSQSAAKEPKIELALRQDTVLIKHQNIRQAEIRFYSMDLELLFSKTPFIQNDVSQLAMIAANESEPLTLQAASGTLEYRLSPELAKQTLLVEVTGQGVRQTIFYYGGNLTTYVAEAFGQVQVLQAGSRQPISGAYVKVYAKHRDSQIRFYKDGYTDLRGRFDYTSLSTPELATTEKFAILVVAEDVGATLHEVAAPAQ